MTARTHTHLQAQLTVGAVILACLHNVILNMMLGVVRNLLKTPVSSSLGSFSHFASVSTVPSDAAPKGTDAPLPSSLQQNDGVEKDKLFSRLEIELRGIDPAVLKSYSWFAVTAANHLGIEVGKCWAPRKAHHDRLTLLKSVHIFKKHRVQYEIRTHFRFMNFHKLTGSTLDTFLEYIERNLPEGVALNGTKVEIQELPEHLKEMPSAE